MWAASGNNAIRDDALASPSVEADFLWRVLDEVDYGLILVDARMRIRHANHLARHEIARGRHLRVADGEIGTTSTPMTQRLRSAVAAGFQGSRRLLVLGTDEDNLPLAVIPMHHRLEPNAEVVLLALSRQPGRENLALTFFAQALNITPAEEAVLRALCDGMEVYEIAAAHHVAVSTVRAQIRSLRSKTNCTSIRQLLHRVATLPPVVPALRVSSAY